MVRLLRKLKGIPRHPAAGDLPPREIDLSNVEIDDLRRVFHAGTVHGLVDVRKIVNREKAEWLESYLAERIDTETYSWTFLARWVEE